MSNRPTRSAFDVTEFRTISELCRDVVADLEFDRQGGARECMGSLNAPPYRASEREDTPGAGSGMRKGRASEQFTARQVKQGRTAPGLGDGRMGNLSGVELQPERTPRPISLRLLAGGRDGHTATPHGFPRPAVCPSLKLVCVNGRHIPAPLQTT